MNTPRQETRLSRGQRIAAMVALLLLAVIVGVAAVQRWQEKRHPEPARVRPALPVEVLEVQPAPFGVARAYRGGVEADARAVASARITARVLTIHHREGATVREGDALLTLDDEELRRESERLRAVAQRLAGELEIAERQLVRDRELRAEGMVPERTLDESLQRARTLEAQQRENRAAIALVGTRLAYAVERAPFDGIVQRNFVQAGELAALGQPLIELVSSASLKALIAVPQADIALIMPGQAVRLEVPALRRDWPATIDRIYPALDETTRNATVASFFPIDAGVRPGMAVTAHIELEAREQAITVPAHAVRRDDANAWVWLLENGEVRRRDVIPGLTRQGVTLIETGLEAGERVIVTPDRRLVDGAPVSVPGPQNTD
jgi:RND family efflux transporter MFP subunit